MTTFAAMEEIKYDYIDDDVLMLTEFGELVKLETQELDSYLVLACNKGRLMVDVNGETIQMQGVEALILPPKTRLSNYMASPDLSYDFVGISSPLVKRLLGSHIEEWNRSIYVNRTNHIVADEEVRRQFAYYRDIIYFKMQQHERRFHHEVVHAILQAILFDYLEKMLADVPVIETEGITNQKSALFKRFLELLTTRHVKHQLVDTYAQELCVSPNYLTKVTREVSGKTALEWIREYTEADVRYYLLNTDLSVKEIAEELGFPNLSFFGKFCRRAFGYSPNDFRRQNLSR